MIINSKKIKICYFGSGQLAADLLSGMLKNLKFDLKSLQESKNLTSTFPDKKKIFELFKNLELKYLQKSESEIKNGLEFEIVGVITQPDRKLRKKILINPVAKIAENAKILTFKPGNLRLMEKVKEMKCENDEVIEKVENNKSGEKYIENDLKILELNKILEVLESSDLILTASYGQILSEKILQKSKFGAINWHPSKLPKYRGASPLQQTLLDGNIETALSWIEMVKKMDAGNIVLQIPLKIKQNWSIFELSQEMINLGIESWKVASLIQIKSKNNLIKTLSQNQEEVSFCHKISKEDGFIEIEHLSSEEIRNHWRAYLAFPKTTYFSDYFKEKIKILELGKILKKDEFRKEFNSLEIIDKNEFIQISKNKKRGNEVETGLKTFLKTKNGYLEIKKICRENGKNLDFRGFEIK